MKNRPQNLRKTLIFITCCSVVFIANFSLSLFKFPVAIAQNNTKAEADKLQQQGEQQLAAGQYTQGTESLERAMRIYRQIGDIENAKKLRDRLIRIYSLRGASDKLQQLNSEQSEQESREENPKSKSEFELNPQVKELISQGFSQQNKRNYIGAKTYFEQALSQAKAIGGEQEQIAALAVLGAFYLYNEDYVNALANLESAERLSAARYQARKPGDYYYRDEIYQNRIPILSLIGETYLQQNNPSKALTYLQEAYAIGTRLDNEDKSFLVSRFGSIDFVDPSLYLSRAYYSLGNYNQALAYARKAVEKGEIIQSYYETLGDKSVPMIFHEGDFGNGHGHVLAGIALEKLGQLEQAEQELRQAIQVFEAIRKKSRFQGFNKYIFKIFNNQIRATSFLQRVLLTQNKPAEALAAAEWGRARLSLEAATAPSNLTLKEKVDALVDIVYTPESICKEISQNNQNYLDSQRRMGVDRIYNSEGKAFLLSDLVAFDCDQEAQAQIQEKKETWLAAAKENPASLDELATLSSKAPSDIKPPNVEQLKQIAQSHQATLVEYSIISETTFFHPALLPHDYHNAHWNAFPGKPQKLLIWVIKPTGEIQSRQIDLQAKNINLEDLVANTRQTMGLGRNPAPVLKPGAKLPPGSTRNASGLQAKEKLKQLHQLLINPIADLLPTNPEAKVVFVPHQQLFLVPFAALIDSKNKYLIEKHTILTAPSIQVLEVTRQKQQKQTGNSKLALVVGNPTMPTIPQLNNQPPVQLPNLPGAEAEGKAVAKLLNTQVLTGNQATKAQVLKQLPNARYIHLAAHGLLDDYAGFGVPGAIALAPSNQDNGLLTASDIQELNLTAELAVLSACDTGRGDITGDGVVGLSRALIIAGVPSIVVSLWSVPDAPTAELMVEFYRNFQERKLDKAQALRQAMLKIAKTHPDPVDWAAFTLIGEAK